MVLNLPNVNLRGVKNLTLTPDVKYFTLLRGGCVVRADGVLTFLISFRATLFSDSENAEFAHSPGRRTSGYINSGRYGGSHAGTKG